MRNSCTCMYSVHILFHVLPCQCWPGSSAQWHREKTLQLVQDQTAKQSNTTTGREFSCPDSSSSQCWSSTYVSMMCVQNSVTFSTLYSRVQTDMLVALRPSCVGHIFPQPFVSPISSKGVSFVQVLAPLFLSLSLPQEPHCLASVLPLSLRRLFWIRCVQSSLGPAGHSSEGQSHIIHNMIKM